MTHDPATGPHLAHAPEVTAERVVAEYARIAFANIDDYIAVDDDGGVRVDLAKSTRDQRAALAELTLTGQGGRANGTAPAQRVKIRLANKVQALNALARHLGLLVKKPVVKASDAPEDLRQFIAIDAELREQEHTQRAERAVAAESDDGTAEPLPVTPPAAAPPRVDDGCSPRPARYAPPGARPHLPYMPGGRASRMMDSYEALKEWERLNPPPRRR